MKKIIFATGNKEKIQIARMICAEANIKIIPQTLLLDEIQAEDAETIIKNKVRQAFEKLREPVVVSDDAWDIKALRGFPGPYIKSINTWFIPEDYIRLMNGVEDRRITLHQYLAYTDGNQTKVFRNDIHGVISNEAKGRIDKYPNMSVIILDADNGKTIAEVYEQGLHNDLSRYKRQSDAWHYFVEWARS